MSPTPALPVDPILPRMLEEGFLRDIDVQLVSALIRRYEEYPPEQVQLLLALACRATDDGHVCLDLSADAIRDLPGRTPHPPTGTGGPTDSRALAATLAEWIPAAAIQLAGYPRLVGAGPGNVPFVLEGNRLYLRRFWNYEQHVADRLRALAGETTGRRAEDFAGDLSRANPPLAPRQIQAIHCALERRLAIVTGGPGTGKTFVAAYLMVLLAQRQPDIRIRMAGPTGKAAARMADSVSQALARWGFTLDMPPARTLEGLLGYRAGSPYFRHDRDRPLPADVVIVDETSMIDLPKMAKLLDAIGPQTQLILLGDKDQLASVEPGSVMAELCQARALDACIVTLTESQRFRPGSPVDELSRAVNAGDADAAWGQVIRADRGLSRHSSAGFSATNPPSAFRQQVQDGFREYLEAREPEAAFAALSRFRVLCALRRGPQGVESVNRAIEDRLFPRRNREFYDHRAILITRNDPETGLNNGDVGVVLPDPGRGGEPAVFIEGRPAPLPCRLLPEHETAFAMTIHKAQGSGFGKVVILLPDRESPILTRELLYTAITRTESDLAIWCEEQAFKSAVAKPTKRHMGLKEKLDTPPHRQRECRASP